MKKILVFILITLGLAGAATYDSIKYYLFKKNKITISPNNLKLNSKYFKLGHFDVYNNSDETVYGIKFFVKLKKSKIALEDVTLRPTEANENFVVKTTSGPFSYDVNIIAFKGNDEFGPVFMPMIYQLGRGEKRTFQIVVDGKSNYDYSTDVSFDKIEYFDTPQFGFGDIPVNIKQK